MAVIQPRMLKDFLQDQNLPFPRSRRSSISVFLHAAMSSVKSSSILRRSISRRFSNKFRSVRTVPRVPEPKMSRTTSVTVKDILRWKSFRDLADPVEIDAPPPSDFTPETATTATTTSAGTPRSSWCDSDFTVADDDDDDSPVGFHVNIAGGDRKTRDLKDRIVEEEEQFSPISVLNFTHENEETLSPFHQILEDIERRNVVMKQRIQEFESLIEVDGNMSKHVELLDTESFIIEEWSIWLMDHVKTTSSIEEWDLSLDCLLLDYFRDELITSKDVKNNGRVESRVLNVAKCWVRGEDDGCLEWKMEGRREVCVREMDKRTNWNNFEDDREDVVVEIEKMMLNHLLDELSIDLLNV